MNLAALLGAATSFSLAVFVAIQAWVGQVQVDATDLSLSGAGISFAGLLVWWIRYRTKQQDDLANELYARLVTENERLAKDLAAERAAHATTRAKVFQLEDEKTQLRIDLSSRRKGDR